jgi:uncharacterized protein (DUF305 family)
MRNLGIAWIHPFMAHVSERAVSALLILAFLCLFPLLVGTRASADAAAWVEIEACATPVPSSATPTAEAITDLQLIDALIANNTKAIVLASEGLTKAQDIQVRRIALRVAESEAGELQLLRSWRSAWYPDAPPVSRNEPGAVPVDRLPGNSYDRALLQMLVASFQATIEVAKNAANRAEHEQLRDYARSVAKARTSDIELLQACLRSTDTSQAAFSQTHTITQSGSSAP